MEIIHRMVLRQSLIVFQCSTARKIHYIVESNEFGSLKGLIFAVRVKNHFFEA